MIIIFELASTYSFRTIYINFSNLCSSVTVSLIYAGRLYRCWPIAITMSKIMYRQVQVIYIQKVFTQKINRGPAFDYNLGFSKDFDNILYVNNLKTSPIDWYTFYLHPFSFHNTFKQGICQDRYSFMQTRYLELKTPSPAQSSPKVG